MSKNKFILQVITAAAEVGKIAREAKDLVDVYTDRGYGTSDPLTAADLDITQSPESGAPVALTLAQFMELSTVLVDLLAFYNGTAVATKARSVPLNKYTRSDV